MSSKSKVPDMDLSEEDIKEFMAIWREELSEELTPDEARHQASQLLELYLLLAKPLPSEMSSDNNNQKPQ